MWLLCGNIPFTLHAFLLRLIILVCCQCGGNFAGFQQMGQSFHDVSFPIAEIAVDGSSIIQKQPNQNGMNVYPIALHLLVRTNVL